MKVAAVRRDPTKEDGGLCDIPLSDKKELFAQSDFVVCVLPGTPQTLDYCGAEEFAAMKPSAVFISIGRGVCVDEGALAAALQAGKIKGAALDVFKVEPLPETSPLWDCGEPPCLHCLPATAPFFAQAADAKPVFWRSSHTTRRLAAENLLMTAHNADYTDDYFHLGWEVWVGNFERFAAGESLNTPVDLSSGY